MDVLKLIFYLRNLYFSFVSTSLAYITIFKNKTKQTTKKTKNKNYLR